MGNETFYGNGLIDIRSNNNLPSSVPLEWVTIYGNHGLVYSLSIKRSTSFSAHWQKSWKSPQQNDNFAELYHTSTN